MFKAEPLGSITVYHKASSIVLPREESTATLLTDYHCIRDFHKLNLTSTLWTGDRIRLSKHQHHNIWSYFMCGKARFSGRHYGFFYQIHYVKKGNTYSYTRPLPFCMIS